MRTPQPNSLSRSSWGWGGGGCTRWGMLLVSLLCKPHWPQRPHWRLQPSLGCSKIDATQNLWTAENAPTRGSRPAVKPPCFGSIKAVPPTSSCTPGAGSEKPGLFCPPEIPAGAAKQARARREVVTGYSSSRAGEGPWLEQQGSLVVYPYPKLSHHFCSKLDVPESSSFIMELWTAPYPEWNKSVPLQ